VVEGVDDYWIVSELSNLLIRSGEAGLPDDVLITPAGGASEAGYIATFMIGQDLKVVVLLDTDRAGEDARDGFVKRWLTRHKDQHAEVLSLGPAAGVPNHDFAIEDLFPVDFYTGLLEEVYAKQLAAAGVPKLVLTGTDMLCKRVERELEDQSIKFNNGSGCESVAQSTLSDEGCRRPTGANTDTGTRSDSRAQCGVGESLRETGHTPTRAPPTEARTPAPTRARDQRPGLTSSTIHPARWSTDGVAGPGNRESQLRTDSAGAQAVKSHNCPAEGLRGVRARRSPPCTRAIGSYSLMTLWQDLRVAARLLGRHAGFTLGAVLTLCPGITGTRTDGGPDTQYNKRLRHWRR
jgi:hypothetical protein